MIEDQNQNQGQTYTGTIVNINNKYVINNDRRFILQTPLLNSLLPNDIVEYSVDANDKINILNIVSRENIYTFAIVKSISTETQTIELFFPEFPKFFSLQLPFHEKYEVENVLLLNITKDSHSVVKIYDSIQNRKNDKDLILSLYKLNASDSSILPIYNHNHTTQNSNTNTKNATQNSNYSNTYYTQPYKDLTHLYTFNVDPPHSKDFDDAISIDPSNIFKIYVHIVDANMQIIPNSVEDINALKHAFTLYLPEHIENILPAILSENKLSLIKFEKRRVITVEFTIHPLTQDILHHEVYPSEIIIKERYNYESFLPVLPQFPQLVRFYKSWSRKTLNIPHVKMNINCDTGKLSDYVFELNTDNAHKMVETLMILTNLTISTHIPQRVPQRFHSKVKSEFQIMHFSGNTMIDSILTIKKYKPAIYDATQEGHFGLGLNSYTHFTSPIRRYFDVVIHRLLAGIEYTNLENVLEHVNKREVQIEKWVELYESLKWMTYFDEHKQLVWDGYVTNVTNVGVVALLELCMYEVFVFVPNSYLHLYNIGTKVRVKITNIQWNMLNIKAKLVVVGL